MGERSKIEWTDATCNPVTGCTPVSAGCANCYASREHARRHKAHLAGKKMAPQYARPFETVQLHPDRLGQPFGWRKPRRIFVCSGSDLFHEDVPIEFIADIFDTMACATLSCGKRHEHQEECWMGDPHTFIILTKRAERMRYEITEGILNYVGDRWPGDSPLCVAAEVGQWPLPNVHVGVSIEDKSTLWRLEELMLTPAAVRFVSYEPALRPVDFSPYLDRLDGIICGGESGPGARPMHPDWARSVRDQCAAADVPFFFKQWGRYRPWEDEDGPRNKKIVHVDIKGRDVTELPTPYSVSDAAMMRVGKKAAGRVLDGRTHDSLPGEAVSQGRSRDLPWGKLLTAKAGK